jgi:hypothetical protein
MMMTCWSSPRKRMKIKPIFAWYDFWVGLYWDRAKRRLYVLPVPMFGFFIQFKLTCEKIGHEWVSCGARPCPKELTDNCSQTVYACKRCGEIDYGYPGGPGAADCDHICKSIPK